MTFFVSSEGANRLGLVQAAQDFADTQCVAAHLGPAEAAANVLDQFKRALAAELELLEIEAMA